MKNFEELIEIVQKHPRKKKVAVAAAHEELTLEGINRAYGDGLIVPVLIGDKEHIETIIKKEGFSFKNAEIIHSDDDTDAAKKAVKMANENEVDFIMKGNLRTDQLLKQVVDKEHGIKVWELMSHIALFDVPSYHKIMVITDGGMIPEPNLNQKAKIIENAVRLLTALGYEKPKVAALAASEAVNPKIATSLQSAELKRMNQENLLKGCIVEGPISYDLAVCRESAEIKGYESPVAGDADIFLVPDMTAGNLMAKSLNFSAGARMAGIVAGAKVPIVLVSRSASPEEKYFSILLAAAAAI